MTNLIAKICPRCNGSGDALDRASNMYLRCPICGGTGKAPQQVAAKLLDVELEGWAKPRVYTTNGVTPSGRPATTYTVPLKDPASILGPRFLRWLAANKPGSDYDRKVLLACADRIEALEQALEGGREKLKSFYTR